MWTDRKITSMIIIQISLNNTPELNEIVKDRSYACPEIAIRAIPELHRIEISVLRMLWKRLL